MSWKAITQSAIGTSHIKSGLPCQDYGDYELVGDNIIIGAVADGAGSAKYSDVGSQLAVETALRFLKHWIINFKNKYPNISKPISKKLAQDVFTRTLKEVISCLNEKFQEGYIYKDLSCTLLAFIATPHWMAAMQVGDGFMVMRSQSPNSGYQLLFLPAKGEYANQTTFVTSASVLSELQVGVISDPPKFIFTSTDGLERLAINLANTTPHKSFFQWFEKGIEQNNLKEERESIIDLLNSEKVNSKTDDDKTILVCLFEKLPISNSSVRDRDTSKVEKISNVSNVSDEDTSVEETEDTSLESETQVATDEVKPLKPDVRLNTFLILFSQSFVFGFLTGIFLHYNYHISKISNVLSKLYHSLLLVIIISFISLFEIVTFLELKKQIKKANASKIKTYFFAFILLCFGIGLGWLVYFLISLLID